MCLKVVVVIALDVMSEERRPASPGTRRNSNFARYHVRDQIELHVESANRVLHFYNHDSTYPD
jgi:hypothetical protein